MVHNGLWRFAAKISRIRVDRLENADLDRVLPQQRSHAALPGDMNVERVRVLPVSW